MLLIVNYLFCSFALCFFLLYLWLKKKYKYWDDLGVKSWKPKLFYGNYQNLICVKSNEADITDQAYQELKGSKYGGIYFLWKPQLLLRDPELIKKILLKDFYSFPNHSHISDVKYSDSVINSLFFIDSEHWKSRRYALAQLFSPKRLKAMKPNVAVVTDKCIQRLKAKASQEEDSEIVHLLDDLSAGAIMSSFIGVQLNHESEFISVAKLFATPDIWTVFKIALYRVLPKVYKVFVKTTLDKRIWQFFSNFVEEVISFKMKQPGDGIDLFSFLAKCKLGQVKGLEEITLEQMVGDTFSFFIAGHDTTSLSISLALFELSRNPEIQTRLRTEVKEAIKASNGQLSFEALKLMSFMDNVIKETLRMYPVLGVLKRVARKDYKVDENLTIPKGTEILIPCRALHYDSRYFENPNEFNPDRFANSTSWMWMPFGKGPRQCIGMRFAEMEMKVVLASLLTRFEFLPSKKMQLPIKFDSKAVLVTNRPENGVWVKLRLLEEKSLLI